MERKTFRSVAVLGFAVLAMGALLRPSSATAACSAAELDAALNDIAADCGCPSSGGHGAYVQCGKASLADDPKGCRGKAQKCVSKSTCGTNKVKCCRTTAKGKTKCEVKSSAGSCKAPKGGSASTGAGSCCTSSSPGGAFTGCSPSGAFMEVSEGLF